MGKGRETNIFTILLKGVQYAVCFYLAIARFLNSSWNIAQIALFSMKLPPRCVPHGQQRAFWVCGTLDKKISYLLFKQYFKAEMSFVKGYALQKVLYLLIEILLKTKSTAQNF